MRTPPSTHTNARDQRGRGGRGGVGNTRGRAAEATRRVRGADRGTWGERPTALWFMTEIHLEVTPVLYGIRCSQSKHHCLIMYAMCTYAIISRDNDMSQRLQTCTQVTVHLFYSNSETGPPPSPARPSRDHNDAARAPQASARSTAAATAQLLSALRDCFLLLPVPLPCCSRRSLHRTRRCRPPVAGTTQHGLHDGAHYRVGCSELAATTRFGSGATLSPEGRTLPGWSALADVRGLHGPADLPPGRCAASYSELGGTRRSNGCRVLMDRLPLTECRALWAMSGATTRSRRKKGPYADANIRELSDHAVSRRGSMGHVVADPIPSTLAGLSTVRSTAHVLYAGTT